MGIAAYNRGSRAITQSIYGPDWEYVSIPRPKDWGTKTYAKALKKARGYLRYRKMRDQGPIGTEDLADVIQSDTKIGRETAEYAAMEALGLIDSDPRRNPRRRNPPKRIKPMTGKDLVEKITDVARENANDSGAGYKDTYYTWLRNNKEELITVTNGVLREHYQARAMMTKRSRKQREADVAGSIDKDYKTGRGANRMIRLFPEEIALVGVTPEQRNMERYSRGSRYTYPALLTDAQLGTLWGYWETKWISRQKQSKAAKAAPKHEWLPPGPWSNQIPATMNAQGQVASVLQSANRMKDIEALWPHARIYREEWKKPWHIAWTAAVDEVSPDVIAATKVDTNDADLVLEHSPEGGTVLHINTQLEKPEYIAIAKDNGFKWSRNEQFAYRVRSRGRRKPTMLVGRVIRAAKKYGYTIAYDPSEDLTLASAIAGGVAAAEQSADHHRDKALTRSMQAGASFSAAREGIAGIPPGQPILVGHHSEKRHRRDLARHDTRMRAGIEAQGKAEHSAHKARSAERRAAHAAHRRDVTTEAQTIRIPARAWEGMRIWEGMDAFQILNANVIRGDRGSMLLTVTPETMEAVQTFAGSSGNDGFLIEDDIMSLADMPAKERRQLKQAAMKVASQVKQLGYT